MSKQLTTNLQLKDLKSLDIPTPFLLIDLDEVKKQYKRLKKTLAHTNVYYAVKCNPDKRVLETLKNEGSNFEIASIKEMKRLLDIGVDPKKIIFSNTVKMPAHIEEAARLGIHSFAFDSYEEINKIAKYAPGSKVYVRMSVSNRGSLIELSSKFGADPDHIITLLLEARERGLDPIGLSFHVGSQAENLSVWRAALERSAELRKLLKKVGIEIEVLNIGGGFPIKYSGAIPSIDEIGSEINRAIHDFKLTDLSIWCEPGRYIAGTSGVIGSEIILRTARDRHNWLFLDVGRFQAFVEMFESEEIQYPVHHLLESADEDFIADRFVLTGPSCDSYDTIMKEVRLPAQMGEGDRLFFTNTGAYTVVYGSNFNDFPMPKIHYYQDLIEQQ